MRTCQGTKPGDSINPMYLDRIVTAATIAEAIDAYSEKRYADALKLYETALDSPGGNQLRVHTGLYLSNLRLGRRPAAAKAFGSIVDQGLSSQRMGVKFLFKPGTAAMWTQPGSGPVPYTLWLTEIAARAAKRDVCMDVVGHTSATGAEPINERLSLQRAETVKREIDWTGLDFPEAKFDALQAFDRAAWRAEVLGHEELFIDLHASLPKEMMFERELLICRM